MTLLRNLLRIPSRVGVPGTLLQLGDAGGRVLYLELSMSPVSVIAGLDEHDAEQLHEALGTWLRERADQGLARPVPAPRIPGILGRLLADADASTAARTVQLCTVPDPAAAP